MWGQQRWEERFVHGALLTARRGLPKILIFWDSLFLVGFQRKGWICSFITTLGRKSQNIAHQGKNRLYKNRVTLLIMNRNHDGLEGARRYVEQCD